MCPHFNVHKGMCIELNYSHPYRIVENTYTSLATPFGSTLISLSLTVSHTMVSHCMSTPHCLDVKSISDTGADSEVTGSAQKMLEACEVEMKKVERELEQLEAEINPALDDNAMVAFSYLLTKVIDEMRAVPDVS